MWLTLYSWDEPFLNPPIQKFVDHPQRNRIATILGSCLNKPLSLEMEESIIKPGLDVLVVSRDGLTQEVYETYRLGGRADRVLDSITG